jgi:hypothetical protein
MIGQGNIDLRASGGLCFMVATSRPQRSPIFQNKIFHFVVFRDRSHSSP